MDSDQTYAAALMNYLNRREDIRAEVQAFSDFESLRECFREHGAGILMISEKDLKDLVEVSQWRVDLIVVLTAKDSENGGNEGNVQAVREGPGDCQTTGDRQYGDRRVIRLSKYQPVSRLMTMIEDAEKEIGISKREREGLAEVIGVFSPVRRCFKTSLALALSLYLAEAGRRVLFISFEPFLPAEYRNGEAENSPDEAVGTLEEALYLVKSRDDGAEKVLREFSRDNMTCLVPSQNVGDFSQVAPEEWKHLITAFRKCAEVDAVVADFDELPVSCPGVLALCDEVYLPTLPDVFSGEKTALFMQLLTDSEAASDMRIRKITVREPAKTGTWHETAGMRQEEIRQYRENLKSGEIGQLAVRLIQEDRL